MVLPIGETSKTQSKPVMKGYDSSFIENRIKWRAGQHNVPYANTDFWHQAPEGIRKRLPGSFDNPVFFSQASDGRVTVIGTHEVAVLDEASSPRFPLDDIIDISSPNIAEAKQKTLFNEISMMTPSGVVLWPTEDGKGCFAVWNILLMLARMSHK